ncbi:hypothetical protein GEMRC1_003642 [Eukaryota sp. GEM-RC1]
MDLPQFSSSQREDLMSHLLQQSFDSGYSLVVNKSNHNKNFKLEEDTDRPNFIEENEDKVRAKGLPSLSKLLNHDQLTREDFHPQWQLCRTANDEYLERVQHVQQPRTSMYEVMGDLIQLTQEQKDYAVGKIRATLQTAATFSLPPLPAETRKRKGRPLGSRNKRTSTQRDPSSFEIATQQASNRRKCGVCGRPGHNRTTCEER